MLSLFLSLLPVLHQEALDPSLQWGSWRGPLGTGVAPAAAPPLRWSEEENVRWKAPLPGLGHSTPILWGDRLLVTTAVPVGDPVEPAPERAPGAHDNAPVTHHQEFRVLALARGDGRLLWERTVHRGLPHERAHATASFASASPVTDGRYVVASFGSYGLFCLTLDGEPVWKQDLGEMTVKHAHGEGSGPVLHGNTVVLAWDHEGDSFLVAFDLSSGEERWRTARDEPTSWSTPIVVETDGRAQVVVSGTNAVRGYDLATGAVLWSGPGLSNNVVAAPVFADGVVYAGSSYERQILVALRIGGAEGDIARTDRLLWTRRKSTPYVPSPLLMDDALYFLHHYQGQLSRVNRADGSEPNRPMRLPSIRNVYASPVGAAGRVYVTDLDGTTVVLSHQATPEVLAVNHLDDSFSASAALAGNELFLRGARSLYCLAQE